jgi:hypothetical protein
MAGYSAEENAECVNLKVNRFLPKASIIFSKTIFSKKNVNSSLLTSIGLMQYIKHDGSVPDDRDDGYFRRHLQILRG